MRRLLAQLPPEHVRRVRLWDDNDDNLRAFRRSDGKKGGDDFALIVAAAQVNSCPIFTS